MNRSMITSTVSMGQLQKSMDLISNNLSNVDTTGYKSRHASFSSLLVQQFDNGPKVSQEQSRITPLGIRLGNGTAVSDTQLDTKAGALKETGRDLDLALLKDNLYFQIESQDAEVNQAVNYTRDGAFYLTPEPGNTGSLALVDKTGAYVLGTKGRIEIPDDFQSLNIDSNGKMIVTLTDGSERALDSIGVANIKRPELLEATGDNKFALPNLNQLGLTNNDVFASLNDETYIKQGALESSNVDMSEEMVDLMSMQRSYQLNARAVNLADQMMGLINTIR